MNAAEIIGLIALIFISLAIGSFLNVCIYRIPNKTFFKNKRSYCPKCNHQLKAKDNIPLFSYIFLKGKCRYCGEKISFRYPFVELINCILSTLVFAIYRYKFITLVYLVLIPTLIVMSFIDLDTMEILDRINITILILGLLTFIPNLKNYDITWQEKLIGMVCVSVPMLILALITKGIGLGDVKLYFVLGLLFGWKHILLIGFFSIIFGGIAGTILLIRNKKKKIENREMPFGPYIAIATVMIIFLGQYILELISKIIN